MTTLKGRCHCGAVEFEVRTNSDALDLRRCNCSICRRKGAIMATAKTSDLTITRGKDVLSLYQWNTGIAKHYFCSVCGIYTHHQRRSAPDEYGFNLGCIENFDLKSLPSVPESDGANMSLVK